MVESRLQKSILNAKVNLVFYLIALFISFFSRKIFLDKLGADFVGLTGTVSNLLDFLNLAEMGIGSAIGVVLYKPLFDKDQKTINEILSVFGYFYRQIGLVILGCGVVLSCFLPLIFADVDFPISLVFFVFYSFLTSTLIGYFANYKQTLLGADQRNYVVTAYFQTSNLIKAIIQMALAYYTQNYFLWVAIELLFGIIYSIILNWKIKQVYPWLASDKSRGKDLKSKYPLIMTYAKQLFIHRIGYLVQIQIKPLLIYAFVSLKTVAFYGNYALIVDKLAQLVTSVLGSTGAGVGNLIAEGDKGNIKKVFWELSALRYFIGGVLVFSLFMLIEPFIHLWVGDEYILSKGVLFLILINMFIAHTRGTVDQFVYGYGLFGDIWAPAVESAVCILVALIGGYFWGLEGVLLGNTVSLFLVMVLWKPYYLYTRGFKESLTVYWRETLKYLFILAGVWISVEWVIHALIPIDPTTSYLYWLLYSVCVVALFAIPYALLFLAFSKGFRTLLLRMRNKLLKRGR